MITTINNLTGYLEIVYAGETTPKKEMIDKGHISGFPILGDNLYLVIRRESTAIYGKSYIEIVPANVTNPAAPLATTWTATTLRDKLMTYTDINTLESVYDQLVLILAGVGNLGEILESDSNLIGKASGGDFTTAFLAGTTITCAGLPATHPTLLADDIEKVIQVSTLGVRTVYLPETTVITVAANVITVTGAVFVGTDTFIVYTNVAAATSGGSASVKSFGDLY